MEPNEVTTGQAPLGAGKPEKIDPITALQDDIDGLSLAMFEALRSLRDAVAPESGNLGGNASSNPSSGQGEQVDIDELWHAYKSGDKDVVKQIHASNGGVSITKREDFIRMQAKLEMEKDTELVHRLASKVLLKSVEIDERVDILPGMHRTRTEQLKYIEELIDLNQKAIGELEGSYKTAKDQLHACRSFIQANACKALGIEEQDNL